MHEMGIILHLAKSLEEEAKAQQIDKILRVTLQVGEVSGIMTDYFTDCWNYFRKRHRNWSWRPSPPSPSAGTVRRPTPPFSTAGSAPTVTAGRPGC